MTDCIINIVSRKAIIQFDKLIKHGVVLVFDESNHFLLCKEIVDTNSTTVKLPDSHKRYSLRILFGKKEILKKISVANPILNQ